MVPRARVRLPVGALAVVAAHPAPASSSALHQLLHLGQADTRDPEALLRLVAMEAIHELSHTYGLRHRRDPGCVMWFSNFP